YDQGRRGCLPAFKSGGFVLIAPLCLGEFVIGTEEPRAVTQGDFKPARGQKDGDGVAGAGTAVVVMSRPGGLHRGMQGKPATQPIREARRCRGDRQALRRPEWQLGPAARCCRGPVVLARRGCCNRTARFSPSPKGEQAQG